MTTTNISSNKNKHKPNKNKTRPNNDKLTNYSTKNLL